MKPENAALAERLRVAIERAGIKQADIARRLDVSPQAVNGWLKTGTIGKPLLAQFAKAVDEDLDYLLTGESGVSARAGIPKRATGRGRGDYKALAGIAEHGETELLEGYRALKPAARRALIAFLAALATACTSPYPTTYQRAGASADDLRMEAAQCRVQAMTGSHHPDGVVAYVAATSIYRDCMIGKGWLQQGR